MRIDDHTEWLEPDGRGGFASGTTSGIRTRRYHALLLHAANPPSERFVLVNGFDAWLHVGDTTSDGLALSTQRYAPDTLFPNGASAITSFDVSPWPTWEYSLADGRVRVRQEILSTKPDGDEPPRTVVVWTLLEAPTRVALRVRPFLSGRDYHALHHENLSFRFEPSGDQHVVTLAPYPGVPGVVWHANGDFRCSPDWYRQFLYTEERDRGLDAVEDLASPGELLWNLAAPGDRAIWTLEASDSVAHDHTHRVSDVLAWGNQLCARERQRREGLRTLLERSADAYVVRRGSGKTIVAGYPWFTDWGRDTFISIRGLCLATGRHEDARDILLEWAQTVSEGMLPNRFPDAGGVPEYNSVDASLWFVVAAGELLQLPKEGGILGASARASLERAIDAIVTGYAHGTRYGIHVDDDGLLAAGAQGWQLTWMDARVGDREITPRIGKPVEVQALWLNALAVAARRRPHWAAVLERGLGSFHSRFWDVGRGWLADVVDVDHVPGTQDVAFRPNQIFAVGGLPLQVLDGDAARQVVAAVERELLTPIGLRSLSPRESGYAPHYIGGVADRDAMYHQGTVWPWLLGAFVEAWVRVQGNTEGVKEQARKRFLSPLLAHLQASGLGHVSEIADAEPPYTPRGCPFQAWSLAELVRLDRVVLSICASSRNRRISPPG
ncbi:MAG: amylo-alpha-1,6-glucosidase [Vicinamibacterales bacterium]